MAKACAYPGPAGEEEIASRDNKKAACAYCSGRTGNRLNAAFHHAVAQIFGYRLALRQVLDMAEETVLHAPLNEITDAHRIRIGDVVRDIAGLGERRLHTRP